MKVLTFSTKFPKGHPRQGQPTWFVEKILICLNWGMTGMELLNSIKPEIKDYVTDFALITEARKHHTIRSGSRFKPGDMVSLRVWSGLPYRSNQIEFAQVEVKKVWQIEIGEFWWVDNKILEHGQVVELAKNDGLSYDDFVSWFNIHPKKNGDVFKGQIICWDGNIEY